MKGRPFSVALSYRLLAAALVTAGCLGDPEQLEDVAGDEFAADDELAAGDEFAAARGRGTDVDGDFFDEKAVEEANAAIAAQGLAALPTCYRTALLDTGHVGPVPVPSAGTTPASTSCVMGVGATSAAVRRLQMNLNECYGENLATDQIFGTRTRDALKRAQRAEGITADGIYGPNTRNALTWWTGGICTRIRPP